LTLTLQAARRKKLYGIFTFKADGMKTDTLVELSATRHRGGYKLVTGLVSPRLPGKEPLRPLRILQPTVSGAKLQRYSPLADDLYVQFARTALTDEAILAFANRYGLLGLPESQVIVRESGAVLRGESTEQWRGEIGAMNYALERWRLAQTVKPGARKVLAQAERASPARVPARSADDLKQVEQGEEASWRWSEPVLAFDDFLEAVNSALPKGAIVLVKTKGLKARLRIVAHSLREVLWFQLAQAKSVDAVIRQCVNASCRKWIAATPGTRSFRRKTCSNSCRSLVYQKNKRRLRG
jgi:hypothetical protein